MKGRDDKLDWEPRYTHDREPERRVDDVNEINEVR